MIFRRCLLSSFGSFGQAVEEKIFWKSTNQKHELPLATKFVNGSGWNKHVYRLAFHGCFLSSFGSFGQAVSEIIFRNWPKRNKNCIWRQCLLTYRDEMRNLYRGSPIHSLVHLDKWFQRKLKCEKLTDEGGQAMSKAHIAFGKVTQKRFYWR